MKLTRTEAKAIGATRCFGKVCARHPEYEGERLVTGSCVECARELTRKRRAADPTKTAAQRRKSMEAYLTKLKSDTVLAEQRKAYMLAYGREYRQEHKAKIRAGIADWNKRNPDKVKQHAAKVKRENKGKVNADTVKRRTAKMHRTPAWLTEDDLWMITQAYELAALRTKMFGFAWHVDHVLPLQGKTVSGFHTPLNLQVIPGVENIRKGNRV